MPVRNRFAEMQDEIAGWRRHLHQYPELQFDVHETAAFVAERLRDFGCDDVVTGIGRTGVVGLIRGRAEGRTIGLRADMDALPIAETTGAEHASKVPGRMHACGHDGHTSMLLGAARYLAETRNFDGTVAVIFQPAEEGGGGGKVMVDEGLMERFGIDEVYGLHNWPGLATGSFAIRPGPFFAATSEFTITVRGRAGHAARPHECIDPIVAASQIVLALQTIASRSVDPIERVVVSVTSFVSSSTAYNIIPGSVELRGTVRTLNEAVQELVEERIVEIVERTASAAGATAEVEHVRSYPVMANDENATAHAISAAEAVAGGCDEADIFMGGEDFAFMLNARPGAYILVGNGDSAALHSSDYDFSDEAIPAGCSWLVEIAERRLSAGR